MGTWDEQYWPTPEEMLAVRAEHVALVQQSLNFQSKLTALTKAERQLPEGKALAFTVTSNTARIKELKEKISRYTELEKSQQIRERGIDPQDPRSIIKAAYTLILDFRALCRLHDLPLPDLTYIVTDATQLYLQYRVRAPRGKLAWVPEQIEH